MNHSYTHPEVSLPNEYKHVQTKILDTKYHKKKIYISSNEKHCTKDCNNCYPLCRIHDTFTDTWASFLCTLVYCANNELRIITFFTGGSVLSSRGGSGWLANMPDYKSSGQGSTPWRCTVEGCFFWGGGSSKSTITQTCQSLSHLHVHSMC